MAANTSSDLITNWLAVWCILNSIFWHFQHVRIHNSDTQQWIWHWIWLCL